MKQLILLGGLSLAVSATGAAQNVAAISGPAVDAEAIKNGVLQSLLNTGTAKLSLDDFRILNNLPPDGQLVEQGAREKDYVAFSFGRGVFDGHVTEEVLGEGLKLNEGAIDFAAGFYTEQEDGRVLVVFKPTGRMSGIVKGKIFLVGAPPEPVIHYQVVRLSPDSSIWSQAAMCYHSTIIGRLETSLKKLAGGTAAEGHFHARVTKDHILLVAGDPPPGGPTKLDLERAYICREADDTPTVERLKIFDGMGGGVELGVGETADIPIKLDHEGWLYFDTDKRHRCRPSDGRDVINVVVATRLSAERIQFHFFCEGKADKLQQEVGEVSDRGNRHK